MSSQQLHYNELQSRVASLQVENAALLSQNASLISQNESLQMELSRYEARRHADNAELVDVKSQLDTVEQDHNELQRLHDRLTCEHETLLTEHGRLKADCKHAKIKVKELMEQNSTLSREMETVAQVSYIINVHNIYFNVICHMYIVYMYPDKRYHKGKVFPYSLLNIGPRADPGAQAVSPQVTSSHPPARLAVTSVAFSKWRHMVALIQFLLYRP